MGNARVSVNLQQNSTDLQVVLAAERAVRRERTKRDRRHPSAAEWPKYTAVKGTPFRKRAFRSFAIACSLGTVLPLASFPLPPPTPPPDFPFDTERAA